MAEQGPKPPTVRLQDEDLSGRAALAAAGVVGNYQPVLERPPIVDEIDELVTGITKHMLKNDLTTGRARVDNRGAKPLTYFRDDSGAGEKVLPVVSATFVKGDDPGDWSYSRVEKSDDSRSSERINVHGNKITYRREEAAKGESGPFMERLDYSHQEDRERIGEILESFSQALQAYDDDLSDGEEGLSMAIKVFSVNVTAPPR